MLSVRLDERQENYLDRSAGSKSDYVRNLIEEDMKRAEPEDPFEEYQRCREDIIHFVKRYGYYKNQSEEVEPVSFLFDYQKELLKDLASGENVIIKKGRRKRVTTTIAHFILWKMIFDPQTAIFSKSENIDSTKHLNWRLPFETGYKNLPDAFKVGIIDESSRAPKLSNGSWIIMPEEVYQPDVSIFEEAGYWNPNFNLAFDSQTVITYTTEEPLYNSDSKGMERKQIENIQNKKKLESLRESLEYKSYDFTKS